MNTNYEDKDVTRIADIVRKSNGDANKAIALAERMARTITHAEKALRRCRAAEEENQHGIAAIFWNRYKDLGGIVDRGALAMSVTPLTKPPIQEMKIEILNISFSTKERPNMKPAIYFWNEGADNLLEFFEQRYTPKQIFMPHVDTVLRQLNMSGTEVRWSQYAGCKTCPRSPGFVLDAAHYQFDIHVHYKPVATKRAN